MPDPIDGFRCVCGEWVAVMHQECRSLLTEKERRAFERGDRRA